MNPKGGLRTNQAIQKMITDAYQSSAIVAESMGVEVDTFRSMIQAALCACFVSTVELGRDAESVVDRKMALDREMGQFWDVARNIQAAFEGQENHKMSSVKAQESEPSPESKG